MLSGTIMFGMGFFRLGFITNLMSYAVVAGCERSCWACCAPCLPCWMGRM